MNIFLHADSRQKDEIESKNTEANPTLHYSDIGPTESEIEEYDVFFLLSSPERILSSKNFGDKPVIINSVANTLSHYPQVKNLARINGWTGFLKRDRWEVTSTNNPLFEALFNQLGWQNIFVKDTPGLVAGRVISMIINEAFIALQEGVSTKEEIDLAMKLGTNYPYGPFEWASFIGIENIHDVLNALAKNDSRCTPVFSRDGNVNY